MDEIRSLEGEGMELVKSGEDSTRDRRLVLPALKYKSTRKILKY